MDTTPYSPAGIAANGLTDGSLDGTLPGPATLPDDAEVDRLLADLGGPPEAAPAAETPTPPARTRALGRLMRQIPVTLTLEVGSARVSLEDLSMLDADSVVELDTLAGEPLTIKVNGVAIGRAEVVISGDNYGLKIVDVSDLSLDSLAP